MRIITGKYKGKKLAQFNYDNIRPTSDNVKEAIFNTLQYNLEGSVFLDLFGGTGNVGFEALSRGAESVYICDNNKNSIALINKNNAMFNNGAIVIMQDYIKALQKFASQNITFDYIFIDPPYKTDLGEITIQQIYNLNLLNPQGIIIFEHHKDKKYELPSFCTLLNSKKYGIKVVEYLEISND